MQPILPFSAKADMPCRHDGEAVLLPFYDNRYNPVLLGMLQAPAWTFPKIDTRSQTEHFEPNPPALKGFWQAVRQRIQEPLRALWPTGRFKRKS